MVGRSGGATDAYYIRKVIGLKKMRRGRRSIVYLNLSESGAAVIGDMLFAGSRQSESGTVSN